MSDAVNSNHEKIAAFDAELESVSMVGQWKFDHLLEQLHDGPFTAGQAHLWRWETIGRMLDISCEALPQSDTVRRTLAFSNPGLPTGSTQTLLASVQMVRPGELAWAHKHSPAAIRFVIDGDPDLYTVVDGKPLTMEKHDLILTPAWTWHDHHNEGSHTGIWLDVLNLPLVGAIKQLAYAVLGEKAQDVLHPRNEDTSQILRFPWVEMEQQLNTIDADTINPCEGIVQEYLDPISGEPPLPSLSCNVQLLPPGFTGGEYRKTSCSVFYVMEGSGTTILGDKTLAWRERDVFVIPNWIWHSHKNNSPTERALLFAVNDSALLNHLGIERRQTR